MTELQEEIQKLKENFVDLAKMIGDMNSTTVKLKEDGKSNKEIASKIKHDFGKW